MSMNSSAGFGYGFVIKENEANDLDLDPLYDDEVFEVVIHGDNECNDFIVTIKKLTVEVRGWQENLDNFDFLKMHQLYVDNKAEYDKLLTKVLEDLELGERDFGWYMGCWYG